MDPDARWELISKDDSQGKRVQKNTFFIWVDFAVMELQLFCVHIKRSQMISPYVQSVPPRLIYYITKHSLLATQRTVVNNGKILWYFDKPLTFCMLVHLQHFILNVNCWISLAKWIGTFYWLLVYIDVLYIAQVLPIICPRRYFFISNNHFNWMLCTVKFHRRSIWADLV